MSRKAARDNAFKCIYEYEFNKDKDIDKIIEEFNFYEKAEKVGDIVALQVVIEYINNLCVSTSRMGYDFYDFIKFLFWLYGYEFEIRDGAEVGRS